MTQSGEIDEVLRHPNAIEQAGQYQIVIGDNSNGQGQVILRVLGGLVITASSYEQVIDPLGRGCILTRMIHILLGMRRTWTTIK